MSLTITRTGDWRANPGDRMSARVTIAFDDSYPTGGESLTPEMLALGEIDVCIIGPHLGYVFEYNYSTKKVMVFQGAGGTPTGTISAPVFTGTPMATHGHTLIVVGAQGAAGTDAVTAPAATDILGKQEVGNADILSADAATKGGVVAISAGTPAGTNSVPIFTGGAVAAGALVEVGNGTDLATLTGVVVYAIGRP